MSRSTVHGIGGIVACEHPQAALAGIRMLDAGGTAADACVAMAAVQAVVSPMMTGPGGDAFLLYRDLDDGRTEVRTLSVWRSREDIVAFAGERIETAVFYPEDDRFLVGRQTTVEHFDVAWSESGVGGH